MRKSTSIILICLLSISLYNCANNGKKTTPIETNNKSQSYFSWTNQGIQFKASKNVFLGKLLGHNQFIRFSNLSDIATIENDVYILDENILYQSVLKNDALVLKASHGFNEYSPSILAVTKESIFLIDNTSHALIMLDKSNFKELNKLQLPVNKSCSDMYWDVENNQILMTFPHVQKIYAYDIQKTTFAIYPINTPLYLPVAITKDNAGETYLVDALMREIVVSSKDGKIKTIFGSYDTVPGSFTFPKGIEIASDGIVFITDEVSGTIQLFNENGALLIVESLGEHLSMPSACAFTADSHLIVLDRGLNTVNVYHYEVMEP
jgi:hypothetical protein